MNIYVGNLSWGLKDQDLANMFASFGEVASSRDAAISRANFYFFRRSQRLSGGDERAAGALH